MVEVSSRCVSVCLTAFLGVFVYMCVFTTTSVTCLSVLLLVFLSEGNHVAVFPEIRVSKRHATVSYCTGKLVFMYFVFSVNYLFFICFILSLIIKF